MTRCGRPPASPSSRDTAVFKLRGKWAEMRAPLGPGLAVPATSAATGASSRLEGVLTFLVGVSPASSDSPAAVAAFLRFEGVDFLGVGLAMTSPITFFLTLAKETEAEMEEEEDDDDDHDGGGELLPLRAMAVGGSARTTMRPLLLLLVLLVLVFVVAAAVSSRRRRREQAKIYCPFGHGCGPARAQQRRGRSWEIMVDSFPARLLPGGARRGWGWRSCSSRR